MGDVGVLVVSHGSRDPGWVRLVDDAVGRMELPADLPVACSFLELVEGRLIQDGIAALERRGVADIVVIPLFLSSGSTHIDEIGYALGVSGKPAFETKLERLRTTARIHYERPIDDDPEIARLLCGKLRPLSSDPAREAVVLVGHGSRLPGYHERWQGGLVRLARQIGELGGFARTETAMLLPDELAGKVRALQTNDPGLRVLVAPLFLSEGYFTNRVIPERLAGLDYRYNGRTLLPSPLMTRWLERRAREALERLGTVG